MAANVVGGRTSDFLRPPAVNIRVGLRFRWFVKHFAQVTPPVVGESVDDKVLVPRKIVLVEVLVLVK